MPNNRIYYYDEATDYLKAIPTSEMHFVPGKGYAIRGKDGFDPNTETANLFKFGGVPNNGDAFTVTVQKKTATTLPLCRGCIISVTGHLTPL